SWPSTTRSSPRSRRPASSPRSSPSGASTRRSPRASQPPSCARTPADPSGPPQPHPYGPGDRRPMSDVITYAPLLLQGLLITLLVTVLGAILTVVTAFTAGL